MQGPPNKLSIPNSVISPEFLTAPPYMYLLFSPLRAQSAVAAMIHFVSVVHKTSMVIERILHMRVDPTRQLSTSTQRAEMFFFDPSQKVYRRAALSDLTSCRC